MVPIGGGGLISGIACALKETNPKIRVIGVEPEKLPSMLRARENGAPITIAAEATIADGIAVRRAGDLTLPLVSRYVDEIVSVDDEEIASAILLLLEQEKTWPRAPERQRWPRWCRPRPTCGIGAPWCWCAAATSTSRCWPRSSSAAW